MTSSLSLFLPLRLHLLRRCVSRGLFILHKLLRGHRRAGGSRIKRPLYVDGADTHKRAHAEWGSADRGEVRKRR